MAKSIFKLSLIGELNRLFLEARRHGKKEIPENKLEELGERFGKEAVKIFMPLCQETALSLPINKY